MFYPENNNQKVVQFPHFFFRRGNNFQWEWSILRNYLPAANSINPISRSLPGEFLVAGIYAPRIERQHQFIDFQLACFGDIIRLGDVDCNSHS